MNTKTVEARYQLTILNYPTSRVVSQICKLIYQVEDKNLLASLSSLPYIVGRSFSPMESESLHTALRDLNVGHRFLSDSAPTLAFDPSAKKAAEAAAAKTENTKDSIKVVEITGKKSSLTLTKLIAGVVLTVLVGAGALATKFIPVRKSASAVSSGTAPAVVENFEAKIESFQKDVEYRIADDLVWKKASVNLSLQEQDAVRTFQDSTAKIQYHEGSRVNVLPNTLMVIGKKENEDRKSIKLEDGSIKTSMKPSDKTRRLSIETASGTLELTSPKAGEAKESKIETSLAEGKLTISVTQGTATLTPKSKDAAPVTINSLEQVVATQDSVSAPIPYSPLIQLVEPTVDFSVAVNPQKSAPIHFSWEAIDENATYELLLSSDPQMAETFLRQKSNAPSVELSYIDLGTVYWQVVGTSDGVNYKSAIRRLYVQKSSN